MFCRHAGARRAAIGVVAALMGCASEPREFYLPERSVSPDTAALPVDFDGVGGAVLVRLTEWPNPAVLQQLRAAGLLPLPGYAEVERLDSVGMSYAGGVVPPGGLQRVLDLQYVVRVEPLHESTGRSRGKRVQRDVDGRTDPTGGI